MKNTFLSVKLQEVVTKIYDLMGFFGGNASIKSQKGATIIEYSLVAALIAVVASGAVSSVGTKVTALFNTIAGKLP